MDNGKSGLSRLLLCTDLDRTLLPNGAQQETPVARTLFTELVAQPQVTLVYVSGRDQRLLKQAIADYAIPVPDFAIGDVGSTIYKISRGVWQPWRQWREEIAPDWMGKTPAMLAATISSIDGLTLQEEEKQNDYKLSYYVSMTADREYVMSLVAERLAALHVRVNLIWSIDEPAGVALLDILPQRANKLHAIHFLMRALNFDEHHSVFAGDSGNDLPVLTSGLPAILVRNADADVRRDAQAGLPAHHTEKLYLADGDFYGLNGNYAAGIIEGVAFHYPAWRRWIISRLTNDTE